MSAEPPAAPARKILVVDDNQVVIKAISLKFKRDNDLDYTPDEIVVSTGAKQSIFNVVLNTSFQYATLGEANASGTGGGGGVSYYTSGPVNYIIAHAAPNVIDINSSSINCNLVAAPYVFRELFDYVNNV